MTNFEINIELPHCIALSLDFAGEINTIIKAPKI
jgi:hypothetical protein